MPHIKALTDDRSYWLMEPSHKPYSWAVATERRVPCACCAGEQLATVFTDGTTVCPATGTQTVATRQTPDLFEMRRHFEQDFIETCRATELS